MHINDVENLRTLVFGLTVTCPFSNDNPSDCPLYKVRQLSLKERKSWVNGLTNEECKETYERHVKCLNVKESR